ncbi:Serine/threonine-protein kinase RIO2, partial [Perkinsus chesapeaki]
MNVWSIQEEQEEDHSIMPREDLPRYSRQNYSYLDAQLEAEHGIDEEADSNLDFTNTQQLRTSLDSIMWKALVKGDYNEWYKSSRLFKAHNLPMDETSYSLLAHGYILSHRHMASSALMEMKEADMHPALVKLNERFIHGYLELQDLGLTPEKTAWQTVLRTCWQCAVRLKRKRLQRIKNYLKDRVHVEDMYQLDRSDVRALISAEHEQARLLIAAHEAQVCGKVDATMLDRKEIKEIAIEKAELLAPPAHGRKHTRKPIYRQINEQRALRDRVSSHIPDPDYFTEGRYTDSNMGLQEGLEPDVLEDNEDDESNNPHVFYCHSVYPYLMRLDCEIFRYLSKEDLRVLQALEVGHKNHELVPLQLVESIAGLKRGGCYKTLQNLLKHKLVAHDGKTYDGYKLTYNGYDFLALRTLMSRGNIAGVGQRVGVGKESDIHICTDDEGRQLVIKFHRLGRVSFKTVKENRDYLQHRQSASWMYLARLAAAKEFAYLTELYNAGFPVPEPVGHNRHAIVMEYLDDAVCMCQIRKLDKPQLLLEKC